MQVPRPVRYSGARMRHFSDSFEDLAARNASHVISRSPMAIASEQMKAARADGHATQRLADVRHSQRDVVNDRATAAQSAVAATLDRPQRALRSFQHALDVCLVDTRKGRQRPEGWTAEVDHLGLTPDARRELAPAHVRRLEREHSLLREDRRAFYAQLGLGLGDRDDDDEGPLAKPRWDFPLRRVARSAASR